jgi:diguanylate cyclase (GGDEF)-like protein
MRSMPRLKGYQQILAVALTAVVGAFAVAAVTFVGVNDARNHLIGVERHSGPQTALLARITGEVTAERLAMDNSSNAPDKATRTFHLQEALDLASLARADWKAYGRNALHLPGESSLQRRYEAYIKAAASNGTAVGLEILASPEGVVPPRSANMVLLLGALEGQISQAQQLTKLYVDHTSAEISGTLAKINTAQRNGFIAFAIAMALGLGVAFTGMRDSWLQALDQERVELERSEEARRTAFDRRLGIGLDMVRVESDAFTVVERALVEVVGDLPVELLIADSSMSHFRRTIAVDPEDVHGCDVSTPEACPATRSGQTLVFESSTSLDACPHLGASATPLCSALCVPVATGGQPIGVIHAKGPDHVAPSPRVVDDVKVVARKTGERISSLRVLADTSAQARTDPLTGLMNRRSVENRVRELVANGREYVVAYADLDHFKLLNDKHGHDTGDRALRLFSQVLADSVRPDDIPARYGGEEFIVVLPDCNLRDARQVLERVRDMLAQRLVNATVPSFTVSFGLAAGDDTIDFNDMVARADTALLTAKRQGRDRVVVAPDPDVPSEGPGFSSGGTQPLAVVPDDASDPVSSPGPKSPTRTG